MIKLIPFSEEKSYHTKNDGENKINLPGIIDQKLLDGILDDNKK